MLKVLDIIGIVDLAQVVLEPTHTRGHIVDWVIYKEGNCLLKLSAIEHVLSWDHLYVLSTLEFA